MIEVPVVDPHHHLWDLETNLYPWLMETSADSVIGDTRSLSKTYLVEDLKRDMAGVGVIKSVHVQTDYDPRDTVGETRWLQSVADADPDGFPHGFVVWAPLHKPEAQAILEEQVRYKNTRGVRQMLLWHPDPAKTFFESDLVRSHDWRKGYGLLKRLGLSFDLAVYANQMADAAQLLARHKETPVALLHAGMPIDRDPEGWQRWRTGMATLASLDHVSVKISGWGMVDNNWTEERLRRFVLETLEIFGTDRAMFASNFPVDRLYNTYPAIWEAFARITADLSIDEKHALFHGTAEKFYRI
ncbi:MAG: amidohydrolase family protein [Devosia sp.]